MLAGSLRHPDLVCQLVPTSTSYRVDNLLGKLLADGFVGELLSVEIQRVGRGFAAAAGELDWRHSQEFSGLNVMNLGSTYESTMRWLGRGNRVMAMAKVHVPYRRAPSGQRASVTLPDHVDVLYELSNRAQVHMRFSETTGLSSGTQTWIHGSQGTIYVDDRQNVHGGTRGDTQLRAIPNPPDDQAVARVETEFIRAIRGLEPVTMNTFEIGVHYMEWTEAVHRSAMPRRTVRPARSGRRPAPSPGRLRRGPERRPPWRAGLGAHSGAPTRRRPRAATRGETANRRFPTARAPARPRARRSRRRPRRR